MKNEKNPRGYEDWCYLNDEGEKKFGDIFINRKVPIVSMITIIFTHPKLENPERAYLLKGSDLTEEQIEKLVNRIAKNFDEPTTARAQIREHILDNQIPIREKLTSGAGTKRIFMYLSDAGKGGG